MRKWRLFWQLIPSYLLITLVALLTVVLYGSGALRVSYDTWTAADLESRARLLEEQIGGELASSPPDRIDALCKRLGRKSATRVTVILPSGTVVGDSEGSPAHMENHADRPEVRDALAGRRIRPWIRKSPTLGLRMMYVAVPVHEDGKVVGVVRTSIPATEIDKALHKIEWRVAMVGLVVALLAMGVSLFVSRRISRPLEKLKRGAEQFARGDLSHRLHVGDSQEIVALAETMNQMAADLDDRIRTAVRERNRREAILSSMVEGVLAVDSGLRVSNLNQSATRLLGVDLDTASGRHLWEVVGNEQIRDLAADVLSSGKVIEQDAVLEEEEKRFLHVRGSLLRGDGTSEAGGSEPGVLLVLHDVTALKRLENLRRDFVANVSHELKTPITSIKGFVETLLDGAMHDPKNAERFLRIVAAQSDRLNEILEDLLTLSRLDREGKKAGISLEDGRLRDVLQAAINACQLKAAEKDVRIELVCDDALQTRINAALLEEAIVNLVDNAVKYSPENQVVHVQASGAESEIAIRVRDHGCGIAPEHLPRLFERFYRVDKARSRKLGGTGLGLAIVKHIAQMHGGRATVESTPGEGSVFSVYLPSGTF